MLCVYANRFGICCVDVGVELMVSTYPTSFIHSNNFTTRPSLPAHIYPKTSSFKPITYQLTNPPYLNIVIINICLTLLGYFPGHIHA